MITGALYISLKVVVLSVILALTIALLILKDLNNRNIRYRKILETCITFPMFLPPSAIGYIILLICGRSGFLGRMLYIYFDISVMFTISAAVIAAIVVILPIMYQSIKVSILSVDQDVREAARVEGANEFEIFIKIILPLSKRGIITGILLSSARAFGEFGATILVAGNIPGKTQTLPMAMYYAIENSNNEDAIKILVVISIIAVSLMSIYRYFINKDY